MNTALAGMPRQWRRALRLHYGGGLTSAELGEVLDKAEPEIERILQCAHAHLRQSLWKQAADLSAKDLIPDLSIGNKRRAHSVGVLINGLWKDEWYDTKSTARRSIRPALLRSIPNWIFPLLMDVESS